MTAAIRNGAWVVFGYGELDAGGAIAGEPLQNVQDGRFFGKDFLYCAMHCQTGEIIVQRDTTNTLPLFVGARDGYFAMSNDYAWVCERMPLLTPNVYVLLEQLSPLPHEDDHTLFREIGRLQERERLRYRNGRLAIETPPHAQVAAVMQNRAGNPYKSREILEGILDEYWARYGHGTPGAELSGGLDSAIAPGYYADKYSKVPTYTLGYAGDFGVTQSQKIADFIQRFRIPNTTIALDEERDFPLARFISTGAWQPLFHDSEIYVESRTKLIDLARSHGALTIFEGAGGDELCDNVRSVDYLATGPSIVQALGSLSAPPFATKAFPLLVDGARNVVSRTRSKAVPAMSASMISRNENVNNVFIERGVWPANPLADPRLYLHFQGLPIRYRANRNILRAYLQARGAPASIFHPKVNEHFGPFLSAGMQRTLQVAAPLVKRGILKTWGILDPDKLIDTFLSLKDSPTAFRLYKLIVVEITLRAVSGKLNLR